MSTEALVTKEIREAESVTACRGEASVDRCLWSERSKRKLLRNDVNPWKAVSQRDQGQGSGCNAKDVWWGGSLLWGYTANFCPESLMKIPGWTLKLGLFALWCWCDGSTLDPIWIFLHDDISCSCSGRGDWQMHKGGLIPPPPTKFPSPCTALNSHTKEGSRSLSCLPWQGREAMQWHT